MANESKPVLTRSGNQVSFQAIQDFYHAITGRIEQLDDYYYDYHLAEVEDFEQFHNVVLQTVEVYSDRSPELTVSVKYVDGASEQFSGIDKFKSQAVNRPVGCVSVELDYRFLVYLPKSQEAREYTVSMGLRSSVGTLASMKKRKATEAEYNLYFSMPPATAKLEITYVDLAMARAIEANIAKWYGSLRSNGSDSAVSPRFLGEAVRLTVRLAAVAAVAFSAYSSIVSPDLSPSEERGLVVVGVAALLSVGYIALPVSSWAYQKIVRLGPQSLVVLSEADRKLEALHRKRSIGAWLQAGVSTIGVILVGLATWYIAGRLGM
ncbi:MAG: hypothetical protein AAFU80_19205 [Pseudomonadota bacterium]